MQKLTVTFGEIMLRLAPPGFERFLQSPQFVATFGGGEANVAVALAGFGLPAAYVTFLPPNNPIADAVIAEMRKFGVDPTRIVRSKGRMPVYYVEPGANQRIVIGGLDPEPLQRSVAEPPRRAVDAVGDEHMVSRREKGEEGRGDGREP